LAVMFLALPNATGAHQKSWGLQKRLRGYS